MSTRAVSVEQLVRPHTRRMKLPVAYQTDDFGAYFALIALRTV